MDKPMVIFAILFCVSGVDAARVGVVVEFPGGAIITECIDAAEDMNGYDLLRMSNLEIEWSPPTEFGHALCSIFNVGCPSDNCFCNTSYWGFYTLVGGEWSYSPVGFDGGFSCSEHYCVNDGDVIGLAYGDAKTVPKKFRFEDICLIDETAADTTTTLGGGSDLVGAIIRFSTGDTGITMGILGIILLLFILIYKA